MNQTVEFFQQYKSKLLWTLSLSAGAYACSQYLKSKLLSLQSELIQAQSGQANIIRRFEQNQQDSTFTVLSFISEISTSIFAEFDVEKITFSLQKQDSREPSVETNQNSFPSTTGIVYTNKQKLWEELKVVTIARVFVSAYALTLLTLFTRLQLNILGRHTYLDAILYDHPNPAPLGFEQAPEGGPNSGALSSDIEQMYLTFFWYFLRDGWKLFAQKVRSAVEATFGGLSLKSSLTPELLAEYISRVRSEVESEMDQDLKFSLLCTVLMPPEEQEYSVLQNGGISVDGVGKVTDPALRKILDETRDLLESPHFHRTFVDCSTSIFNLVLANLGACFQNQDSVKLASVLPPAKTLAQTILSSAPNGFNLALAENNSLRNFSTLVYTQYSNVCGY